MKMCTIPKPPPPPPAPTLSFKNASKTFVEDCNSNIYQPVLNNPSDCFWAEENPELRRSCIVARICLEKPPYKYKVRQTKSVIQVGPTCGLAALSMLLNERVSPDTMLSIAKRAGYTNHGEMLSCNDMGKLVSRVFAAADIKKINYSVKRDLDSPETIECLLNGGMLLVPYDADVNHAPALKNGHTAHWCIVCGIILINKPECPLNMPSGNTYVLSRHGKSKFLSAWSLAELAKSNRNLWEFSPKKQSDNLEYVQPEGGLGGDNGLRSQYLVFNWS